MAYKSIQVEKRGVVTIVTLNRPEKYNAFDWNMIGEFDSVLESISKDRSVRVVILTGAGKAFCSGIDVSALAGPEGATFFVDYMAGTTRAMITSVLKIRSLRKATICAVNGIAAGGGVTYAAACDIRIASDQARFNSAFVKRGLVADIGTTYLLPKLIGTGYACELMLTGDIIDVERALKIGLVNSVVKHEELMPKALELAARIAENPPLTVGLTKMAIYQGFESTSLSDQCDFEIYNNGMLSHTEDYKEGMVAFLEKRKPRFQGK